MPISIPRLRTWFAVCGIALALIVSGFYVVRRYEMRIAGHYVAKKLGIDIQQSSIGFSYSHSEGGRTIYKISAKKATQFKNNGKSLLQDVDIILYGRDSSRFDQIYGSNFEYDTKTGNVVAHGEVDFELEANAAGPNRPDQAAPSEVKNPIHLKTTDLVFNQKTGIAQSDQRIELEVAQARGYARGVVYDSHDNRLTLKADVHVTMAGTVPRTLIARHAVITKDPHEAVLDTVTVTEPTSTVSADEAFVHFLPDNNIGEIRAVGNVEADSNGVSSYQVQSDKGYMKFGKANDLQLMILSENARFRSSGERPMHGFAGEIISHFGPDQQVQTVRLENNAHVIQEPAASGPAGSQQRTEVVADALDVDVRDGREPSKARTTGAAHVTIDQPPSGDQPATTTVAYAGRFFADFSDAGRINHILGLPEVRVISSAPGQADKNSTSDKLEVFYNEQGDVASVVQQGHFTYHEKLPNDQGNRIAFADMARYTPADDMLHLTGSPRIIQGGMSMTANLVNINRKSGEAIAEGNVKSTYSDLKPQPNGAMLASGDPIHVTAKHMVAHQDSGLATYTGGARLWQGPNIVEGPTIEFNRDDRSLVAEGNPDSKGSPVSSVFVQKDKDGKLSPVNVTARKLTYVDGDRHARYEGGVTARSSDGVITADHVDIFLKESGEAAKTSQPMPSQLDHIIATGRVVITQPGRRGTGDKLTYYQDDARYILTGGPPLIYDAQRGTVRGATLTFFSNDDRVLVEGSSAVPTVSHTRVSK